MIEATLYNRLKELDRIESLGNWSEDLRGEKENLKKELNEILVKREISVRQKLKFKCAKEGDANSRLFHRLLSAQKSKNFISKIELDNGEVLTREEAIIREIVCFFERLYTHEVPEFRGFEGVE